MPRIIDLSSQVKKEKEVRRSLHVLDLRKEVEKKKKKRIFEKQNGVGKILNSIKSKTKNLKQKTFKIPAAINNNFKNIKNSIGTARLELNFSKNKFKLDVSRLFQRENKKTPIRQIRGGLQYKNTKTKFLTFLKLFPNQN